VLWTLSAKLRAESPLIFLLPLTVEVTQRSSALRDRPEETAREITKHLIMKHCDLPLYNVYNPFTATDNVIWWATRRITSSRKRFTIDNLPYIYWHTSVAMKTTKFCSLGNRGQDPASSAVTKNMNYVFTADVFGQRSAQYRSPRSGSPFFTGLVCSC